MKKIFYLPINLTLLNEHETDCFAYYCYLRQAMQVESYSFSTNRIFIDIKIDRNKNAAGRAYSGYGRTIWSKYKQTWGSELKIEDEQTTMMPFWVFDVLVEKVKTMPLKSQAVYVRFYLYIYFLCHITTTMYGISVERLSYLLKTNTRLICERIKFFTENKLLIRAGKYKFSGEESRSYSYFIPDELVSHIFNAAENYKEKWRKKVDLQEKI